jgi:hypothetical protein
MVFCHVHSFINLTQRRTGAEENKTVIPSASEESSP